MCGELSWSEIRQFVTFLNVKASLLKDIEEQRQNPEDRKTDALNAWLSDDVKASWKRVISVLKAINKGVLAKTIEEKLCRSFQQQRSKYIALSIPFHPPSLNLLTPSTQTSDNESAPRIDEEAFDHKTTSSVSSEVFDPHSLLKTREKAGELEHEFMKLLTRTKAYFLRKELENDGFTIDLRTTLTDLPKYIKYRHMFYLTEERDRIKEAQSVTVIFDILDSHEDFYDYSDYGLLEHLISLFGTNKLQIEMKLYIKKLQMFEKLTTIELYEFASNRTVCIPANFKRATIKLRDPKKCTLIEYVNLKMML